MRWNLTFVCGVLALAGVCWGAGKEEEVNKEQFHKELLQVAASYAKKNPVDYNLRNSPLDCRMPLPGVPAVSESDDQATHGRKLYYLFAKSARTYWQLTQGKQEEKKEQAMPKVAEPGFWLVKESWSSRKLSVEEYRKTARPLEFPAVSHFAKQGDHYVEAQDKKGLFVMLKKAADTPDTDQGWVYATISPDGKRVTSAGRVASCMKCHEQAQHDRMLGIPGLPKELNGLTLDSLPIDK